MLFEWYKHVGGICNEFACVRLESLAFRDLPPVHYAVLVGLLNRCSRLMLSNVALSANRRFGETTRLIDRCILESAVKIQWLCVRNEEGRFDRYLADGIKSDLHLKRHIEANIHKRDGERYVIEERMLRSIDRCLRLSGLSEQQVRQTKKLQDLLSIMESLDMGESTYIAVQRMGSHAVHGTWMDLITHYLRDDGGRFQPRDHDVETHHNQFVIVILMVLSALKAFVTFMAAEAPEVADLTDYVDRMFTDVVALDEEDHGDDFSTV